MRTLLRPCGHVWGLTMRKCAPCGLERACSFLTCSYFIGAAIRCSQCLLELCSAITFKCRIGSSLSILLGWGMVLRSLSRWVVCGLSRCVFGSSFSVLIFSPAFVPFGLTRLTLDDCLVVFVTDGLMPQGARVTKKGLPQPILSGAQDCFAQSCRRSRIAPVHCQNTAL